MYYRKLKMNSIEKQISSHQRKERQWTATAQRSAGVNNKWHFRAIRQANWHALQVTNLRAKLNNWS